MNYYCKKYVLYTSAFCFDILFLLRIVPKIIFYSSYQYVKLSPSLKEALDDRSLNALHFWDIVSLERVEGLDWKSVKVKLQEKQF